MKLEVLKQNLLDSVAAYLTEENPEQASVVTSVVNFFTRHGEPGRIRAKNYAIMLKDASENNVLALVYADIIDRTKTLDTSRSLRKYLMQAIVESIQERKLDGKKEVALDELNATLFEYLGLDTYERAIRVEKAYKEQAIEIPPSLLMYDHHNSSGYLGHAIYNIVLRSRLEGEVTRDMIAEKLNATLKVEKEADVTLSPSR